MRPSRFWSAPSPTASGSWARPTPTPWPPAITSHVAYQDAGRLDEAIPQYERTVADYERVLGPTHPDALAARNNLALAYQAAGRPDKAKGLTDRAGPE